MFRRPKKVRRRSIRILGVKAPRFLRFLLLIAPVLLFCVFGHAQPGYISTVIGGGPNDIPALKANIQVPYEMAIDIEGNYYVAAAQSHRVFKINPTTKLITVVAGTGIAGYSGDGELATLAMLHNPNGVAVDHAKPANVFIHDNQNCLIRRVDGATGKISTIAGIVSKPFTPHCTYSGDGGQADKAGISGGFGVTVNPTNDDVYFPDTLSGRIRKIPGGVGTATISTVAGNGEDCGGESSDGTEATHAFLCDPQTIALDTSVSPPNYFISSYGDLTVKEVVGATDKMYLVAGTPGAVGFVDNVVATSAQFTDPWQSVVQVSGGTTTITLADWTGDNVDQSFGHRIRQFPLTYSGGVPQPGVIRTIAGTGAAGLCGDGGPATKACLNAVGLAVDGQGNLIFSNYESAGNDRIRKITKSTGVITSVEGWGPTPTTTNILYSDPLGITNVPGTDISLYEPGTISAVHGSSELFVGGFGTQAVYEFNPASGDVTNFAGDGVAGYAGDGTAADGVSTELNFPTDEVRDSSGNIYIVEQANCDIRKVSSTGHISTIAGGSEDHLNGCGSRGDGGPATEAQFDFPTGLAIDAENNLYVGDYFNCEVRKITHSTGIISRIAGTYVCGSNGDGKAALSTDLNGPAAVALDAAGNLYISDRLGQRIRKVAAGSQIVSTIAGTGVAGYSGDGVGSGHLINTPNRIAADENGNVFFADQVNNLLRWVDPAGQMVTFAGTAIAGKGGVSGFGGDGGLATKALLSVPSGVAQDGAGNLYAVDYGNNRVRKIEAFAAYGRSTAELTFAAQTVDTTSAAQQITLSAIGPITIDSTSVPAGFKVTDHCAGVELKAGETCVIDVAFAPTSSGSIRGVLTINSSKLQFSTQGQTVSLSGTATPKPAATPVISPGTGSYTAAQTVKITDATAGAVIYYTTNGAAPTTKSAKYSAPIAVSSTETVQAIAVAAGYSQSATAKATLTIK